MLTTPAWSALLLTVFAWSLPPAAAQAKGKRIIEGKLLVALPSMPDPRFKRTVIYMAGHNNRGALGFIVNRVISRRPIKALLRYYKLPPGDIRGVVDVHYGGPVALDQSAILHTPEYKRPRTLKMPAGLAATADPQVLRDIGKGRGPKRYLVIFGRAGWAPGQLERELRLRTWAVIPFDHNLIFGKDHAAKWRKAMALREVDL
jgi:putative transcriptional regulator